MQQKLSAFLLSLVITFSCSSDKKIILPEKNVEDEISLKGVLSFTFNRDIIPDSLVGLWTEQEYIEIEPPVTGKFHWQSQNKLVFAPAEGYKPATNYTAKFTNEVFKYAKGTYSGDKEFNFHTPYLSLVA